MKLHLAILALAVSAGCQQVTITTNPAGASVYIDSSFYGNTPLRTVLPTDRAHTVELRRPGYQSHVVPITRVRRKPIVDPSISNLSLAMSYLNMLASGQPAGFLLSICSRIVVDKYNYELVPRQIDVELVPL